MILPVKAHHMSRQTAVAHIHPSLTPKLCWKHQTLRKYSAILERFPQLFRGRYPIHHP